MSANPAPARPELAPYDAPAFARDTGANPSALADIETFRAHLEEQRHRYSRLTPTQRGPDRREERIEMILSAVELSAVELSAVELVAGELAVEHPDGLPVGRVSRRIGKPEEHAQVGGRGQGRPDVLLARRLEARRGDVVWNR